MDSQDNTDNLRVASFSAYLNSKDESFVLKLTGAAQNTATDIFSPAQTPRPLNAPLGRNSTTEEGEIGVFGADKYFNMQMDFESRPKLIDYDGTMKQEEQQVEIYHNRKPKFKTTNGRGSAPTPSVSSEASWTSQAAILPSILRNPPRIKHKKGIGKSFLAGFFCNGPCLNKKSVYIDGGVDDVHENGKEMGRKESFRVVNPVVLDGIKQSQSENFAFPILNPGKENLSLRNVGTKLGKERVIIEEELDPRYSIEVFGSHTIKKGDIAMNLERKLSMLTWDAIPKPQKGKNMNSSILGSSCCDDIQSDASSELFEIETLTGTGRPLLTIQPPAADENIMSDCMSPTRTTQYEPSEASIEWSVVTASAADFSFASDFDEKSIIAGDNISKMAKTKDVGLKEGQKSGPGGLLGCKNHKSVSVAETKTTTRTNVKARSISQGEPWRKDFEMRNVI